jgi:hypothetical protein
MIENVIGNYLDNLEEREFDEPFMALLRANGFNDVHFLHGAFEFGKDFIAKGVDNGVSCQFCFQTKAGNIGIGDWGEARRQIDEMRTNKIAHADFDRNLPVRAVFVTTGRLVGAARAASQEYREYLRSLGEIDFIVWEREDLIERMSHSPEVGLAGRSEGPLHAALGKIDAGEMDLLQLERFSRRWIASPDSAANLWRSTVEASVIANRLRLKDRLDLASHVGLCVVRAAWASTHGSELPNPIGLAVANVGQSIFRHYASDIWSKCVEENLKPLAFIHAHEIPTAFVTYPVRCVCLIELLSLLALLKLEQKETDVDRIIEYVAEFAEHQPGVTHPISDRWAVALIPPVLLLSGTGRPALVESILTDVTRWLADRYEGDSFGLAGPTSGPEEEVNYLLGTPFEHVKLQRRSESLISTVVLDLAAILKLTDLFKLARNEFLAVDAMSCVVETRDSAGQYMEGSNDTSYEPNMLYDDKGSPKDGWKVAPHHHRAPDSYYLNRIGRLWDHLAISSVLRDRYYLTTCRMLAEQIRSTYSDAKQMAHVP